MLEKSISSAAASLTCSRNGLASDTYKQKLIVTMKRSMGLASPEKKRDTSSGPSSKDSSPSMNSCDEDNSVRKYARSDRKTGSESRAKKGSSTKNLKAEMVVADVQKSTSSMTAPLLSTRESLTSQVQQLFRQSSLSQPDCLPAASHYANCSVSSEPFGYGAWHPLASYTYSSGQTFATQQAMSSTGLQQGVQQWPWGQVTYPGHYYPVSHMYSGTSRTAASQSYHSSAHHSAMSQLQRKSSTALEVENSEQNQHDVTNQGSDLLSKKQSLTSNQEKDQADRTEMGFVDVAQSYADSTSSHAVAAVNSQAGMSKPSSDNSHVESQSLDDYKLESEYDLCWFISSFLFFCL